MNSERWQRLNALFDRAVGLEADERDAFVRAVGDDEPEMHGELVRLIRSHGADPGFLSEPPAELGDATEPERMTEGTRLGPYRVESFIGEGGMGTVYRATRADEQYEQTVAIKVIRREVATLGLLGHFRRERQTLAELQHPSIPRLIDGGTTPDGLPYLVMEFVVGTPMLAHCERVGSGVRERLEMFLSVCDAVRYAHSRFIVHRDIKPGNILVSDAGEVRLLDFGIARLVLEPIERGGVADTVTVFTPMTPEYSSPEQVRGEVVSAATDVYSLGMVLYELLTGVRAYGLEGMARYERERVVCEEEPRSPSDACRDRSRALRGDLDAVVLRALEKDPERRYGSVEAFAADIGRHLRGEPVRARRTPAAVRVLKFARRRTPVFAAIAVSAASVVLAVGGLTWGIVHAESSRERAVEDRNAAVAAEQDARDAVVFLERLLGRATPFAHGRPATIQDLLDDADALIAEELQGRPEVEAGVRLALARIHFQLLQYQGAVPHGVRALAHYRATREADDPAIAECLLIVGRCLAELSFTERASADGVAVMLREASGIVQRAHPPGHPEIAAARVALAIGIWAEAGGGRAPDETVGLLEGALEMLAAAGEGESAIAAGATLGLAYAKDGRGERAEAGRLFARATEIYRLNPGAGAAPSTLEALSAYAGFLHDTGEPGRAIGVLETYESVAPEAPLASTRDMLWRWAAAAYECGDTAAGDLRLAQAVGYEEQLRAGAASHVSSSGHDELGAGVGELADSERERMLVMALTGGVPVYADRPHEVQRLIGQVVRVSLAIGGGAMAGEVLGEGAALLEAGGVDPELEGLRAMRGLSDRFKGEVAGG
ncbi:MAG: hypothetical protein DHS20C14_01760 [Phycisphaeraceae bacterium]|nr:MAG: hypothetical protein DHS20C14_01760 [Phycisphaeraceae bacterium]